MPVLVPYVLAFLQDFNMKWTYYLNAPPVVLTTLAGDLHATDSGSIADGRYHPALGMVHGPDKPKNEDTAITGTTARSAGCRMFAGSGGDSNWRDPIYNNWGILCSDGTPTGTYDLLADHVHASIETTQIMVWRGPPPYSSGAPPSDTNCFTDIELCAGNSRNYRIHMPFGKAIALQFTSDSGVTWKTVSILKSYSRQEVSFTSQDYIVFYFLPNYTTGQLTIDTSVGGTLQHTPNDSYTLSNPRNNWLPGVGRFRVRGANGWAAFVVNGKVHGPAQVERVQDLKYAHPQATHSWMSVNALTDQPAQTITNFVTPTGTSFDWKSQVALGATDDPPEWSDGQLLIPGDWTIGVPGSPPNPTIVQLAVSDVTITEVLDDNQRTFTAEGEMTLNNDNGRYQPAAGHLALTISSSNDNGATLFKRGEFITSIREEGNVYDNVACLNDLKITFADRSAQMGNGLDVPIGYELQLDNWAFWSAFRLLCHLGGVHNSNLTRLPDAGAIYVPPGGAATADAPYGRADPTYTGGPILGNGTGDNPLHVYGANMTPWQVLQILVQDESLIVGGVNCPYVFGFDVDGYMLCYPFNPAGQSVLCGFTDRNTRLAGISFPLVPAWVGMTRFAVAYSVSQLRSELTLEGQDWLTNEMLVEHRDQPASIKAALGFPIRLLARQERWGDQQYLSTVADGLQSQCSLPVAIGAFSAPHVPFIHAGSKVSILHPKLSPTVPIDFYITSLEHQLHDGADRNGITHGTARAVVNF